MELFTTIALLCQLAAHAGPSTIESLQLDCQKYYVECMTKKANSDGSPFSKGINGPYLDNINLATCIKERKL